MIDPEDPSALLSGYLMIWDLERFLSIVGVELADIPFAIPPDHEALLEGNLKKLNSHKRRLNTLFKQTLNSSVPNPDQQALAGAAEVLLGMQQAYIVEMAGQSFFYEPVYKHLAGYFNDDHSLAMLLEKLDRYFNFSGAMGNSSETIAEAFNHILLGKYLLLSDSLIDHEKFQAAEILLQSAATVCHSFPVQDCDVLVFNKLSATKWGIYDAYISVARSAVEAGNLDMGRNYLDIAAEFQMKNKNLIATDGFTLEEFENLAWEYFQQANGYFQSGRFEDALTSYTAAHEIYRMLDVLKYDELISRKIASAEKFINDFSDVDIVD
jgi:tetratricopeptide (TPR) repeat protein